MVVETQYCCKGMAICDILLVPFFCWNLSGNAFAAANCMHFVHGHECVHFAIGSLWHWSDCNFIFMLDQTCVSSVKTLIYMYCDLLLDQNLYCC